MSLLRQTIAMEFPRERQFRMEREMIDATSLCRPDPSWRYTDPAGHVHGWRTPDGAFATSYNPSTLYTVPTVQRVVTGEEFCDDCSEAHEIAHLACVDCGAVVSPGTTANAWTQMIPGLAHYTIDGEQVDEATFKREYEAYQKRK